MKKTFELVSSFFGSFLVSFTLIKFVRGHADENEYVVTRIVDANLNPISAYDNPELLDLIDKAIDEYIETWYDEENRKPQSLTEMLVMQRDSDHVSRVVVHGEDCPKCDGEGVEPLNEAGFMEPCDYCDGTGEDPRFDNPHQPIGYTTDQWMDAEIALCAASTRRGFIY